MQQIIQAQTPETSIGSFQQITAGVSKRAIEIKNHTGFEHIIASFVTHRFNSPNCAKPLVEFPYTLKRT
jgi:hypothetical protein